RAVMVERYRYYLRLLGQTPDGTLAPDSFSLDRGELTEENFDEAYAALVDRYEKEVPVQAYPQLNLEGGQSPAEQSGAAGQGRLSLTKTEDDEISHMKTARDVGLAASIVEAVATA